jgi:NitT/TauT family transport system ATP-binding protein
MSVLEVRNLEKRYADAYTGEEIAAIADVSFTVEQGEFVSILGPSGCGKTTVLNIIAGFIPASGGSLLLNGRTIEGPGPDRGVVFQSFALFPWKTVLGNVAFGLKVRGVAKDERLRIAREHLALVGLGDVEDKYPHELSGGMQQRVGVARALANAPEVLLMDEPFASIDAQTRMKLQQDLTRIWEERHPTIFFVTHDIDEAVFLSDRVIVLTSRPSRVADVITVDLPRPRVWDRLMDDMSFRSTTRRVVELLGVSVPTEMTDVEAP